MRSKNALSRRIKTFLEKVNLREISTFYIKLEMRSKNALSRRIKTFLKKVYLREISTF